MKLSDFNEENRKILIDVLKGMTVSEIAERYSIKKDKVRKKAYFAARGLYDWTYFADRIDLLCDGKCNPWGTLSEYRIHFREWLALYRAWQSAEDPSA